MSQVRNPRKKFLVPVIIYPDTGESGETYDMDVQTLSWSSMSHMLSSVCSFKVSDTWHNNSESGEAYEAEVYALDQVREELTALTVPERR